MTLPNFLIVGAQKAGTSWLAAMLGQHPEVFVADREVHYFNNQRNMHRGVAWYAGHFAAAGTKKLVGEKTPNYLWVNRPASQAILSDIHRRIHRLLPDAKLIMILRNPVERAISAYNHHLRSSRISPLASVDELLVGGKQHLAEHYGVISVGMYFQQIVAYREVFKPEQMLILCYEEHVVARPDEGLRKVCRFLEIDPDFAFGKIQDRFNESKGSKLGWILTYAFPKMRPLVRKIDRSLPSAPKIRPNSRTMAMLYDLYRPENERLFHLLGWNTGLWTPRRDS
jgi:hypothetical protein